ncbi:MAG: hypothetical protein AVDCRST_MAG91-2639 [uncultured Sphingomonadaceae bacterium]|uniref:Uncharacterized protein n=1 Tax=uncultured Sphingomonadaceae bacterium TaxID=169976 RepID=A0A6J4TPI9_9SPHN|nr:MAG: hypothetical protein AVDCRST_MAG91-2639 [uncultured Sphingomonadaceae bacterium]
MRKALFCVLLFTLVPAGIAVASDGLKVTGGGQVIADDQAGGPGDTIAFNAQQIEGEGSDMGSFPAKGQLQVNNRTEGVRFHGVVTCIREFTDDEGQRFVRFGGFERTRSGGTGDSFVVDTMDNGQGPEGNDMIAFRQPADNADPCEDSQEGTQLRSTRLARGNVKEH